MSKDNDLETNSPSLSQYFGQGSSAAPSFFDQISSGNGPAMMTSVRESASSSDLFQAATPLASNTDIPATMENTAEALPQKQTGEETTEIRASIPEDPVVCRIFSSEELQPTDDKMFFDMIGQTAGLLGVEPISGTSSMLTSPTLTDSLASPTGEIATEEPGKRMSEAERRRDAWIPSDRTKQALTAVASAPPGTYVPERELLTMPGVVLEEDMVDVIHEVVGHYLGESEARQRKMIGANDVTQDERGLRELIQAGCFRAAINLTGRLLSVYGQGAGKAGHPSKHTIHSLQLWFTRLALHVKLRSFSLAEVESEPFGRLDGPDVFFQFYQGLHGGRVGSMAPFAFRLLLAEMPQHVGKHAEALRRLHRLLHTVRTMLHNLDSGLSEDGTPMELSPSDREDSKKLWTSREARVLHSIVNTALYQKDFCLAIEVLEMLASRAEGGQRRSLLSALGRVYLQLGDVVGAERSFGQARAAKADIGPSALGSGWELRDLVDRGLMAVAQNAFQEALELFNKALVIDPGNIMLSNNAGVCQLYLGRLSEALVSLEGAVTGNPTRGLHESLLLNTCTLYELESSRSAQRKLSLLRLVARHSGDGASVACLKL